MKKVFIVGIGPGAYDQMTIAAIRTLEKSDVIIGYTVYVDLIKDYFPGKKFLTTPMTKEIERCRIAYEEALGNQVVSLICSGDPGVYGMAAPLLEMQRRFEGVEVEVIPGVSAVNAGAAVLGAPVNHDFAVISLSDLLTPWDKIRLRLRYATQSDMVIALYNPASKNRPDHLKKACEVLLKFKDKETVCAIVRNIGRDGQEKEILTLGELKDREVDMFCTVFIGNTETREELGNMITPRGYKAEVGRFA